MSNHDANNKYELMAVLQPTFSEDETRQKIDHLKQWIAKNGGEIFHEDFLGKKELVYPVKKQKVGIFVVLNFLLAEAKNLKELEENLRLDGEILRHLLIKTPFDYEIKKYTEEEKPEKREEKRPKERPRPIKKIKEEIPVTRPVPEKPLAGVKPKPAPLPAAQPAEEPTITKKEEPKIESVDEIDERLKKIIEDPDITL